MKYKYTKKKISYYYSICLTDNRAMTMLRDTIHKTFRCALLYSAGEATVDVDMRVLRNVLFKTFSRRIIMTCFFFEQCGW